jgi:hypothetical protein
MNSVLAAYVAAAIGVPVIFFLLRKCFPSLSVHELPTSSLDDLKKEFFKWDLFYFACFISLAGATGYIWWVVFSKIELLNAARFREATICVSATGYVWSFPAMVAGMGSGGFLADQLFQIILKNRYSEYTFYQSAKYKINVAKLGISAYIVTVAATLVMVLMISNWYTLFSADHVTVKRLFAVSEDELMYSDVSHIITAPSFIAPNGKVVNRREYVIKFATGKSWTTNLAPTDLTLSQKLHIAQFVSRMAGVPITEVKMLKKDEAY